MPAVRIRLVHAVAVAATAASVGSASVALAQAPLPEGPLGEAPPPAAEPKPAKVELNVRGVRHGRADVGTNVLVKGRITPFVAGERMRVVLGKGGRVVRDANLKIRRMGDRNVGRFKFRTGRLIKPGRYAIRASKRRTGDQEAASKRGPRFRLRYPDLDPGARGGDVKLFNKLLGKEGYYTANGSGYGSATARAVLAYRKVNNMRRTSNASPEIFRTLADGRGGYKLRYPGAGKHVEVDLSRQVMVLARKGKPRHAFHISSGAPATPTIRGKFRFFRKEYGTNSLDMVHSVYFGPTNRGYATHGYKSVPTYPASHGCLRNPIPNSLFIYNWIDLGDTIYVYR